MKIRDLLIALFIWVMLSYTYTQNFLFLENINNKFSDILFDFRGKQKPSRDIVIVDIDESTLSYLNGFSRDDLSTIIDNLRDANVLIIGLDMIFPQKGKDKKLKHSLLKAPVVLGYNFSFSNEVKKGEIPNNSSIIVQSNYMHEEFLPEATGILSNTKTIQDSSTSSGFINNISDKDGVVRNIPLVIKYQDELYPSLALEISRVVFGSKNVIIEYEDTGISAIRLGGHEILTDRFGRLMLNFKGTSKTYSYISAVKIYKNEFIKKELKNKIILINASTSRFFDLRATPYDSTFSGVEIHANALDNILNKDFLIKPNWIESVDIGVIFVMLFLLFLFSIYGVVKNRILSLLCLFGFLVISYFMFKNFGLVLNILFPLMGGFLFHSISIFLNYVDDVKMREELNTKLILEMQNRQDIIEKEVDQKTKELQKIAEEKTVLLRELHHRVKNNLQLILSITRLQQHDLKDKKLDNEFQKLQNRIKAIAKTHEILCDNDDITNVDMSEYIGELCEEIESGFMQGNIDIDINVMATLPLREAVYVGLIVNEIMSNSIKHAFDDDGGEIHLYLAKISGEYILRITDDGKGYDKVSLRGGSLGLKLMEALVVDQLDGVIETQSDSRFGYIIKFRLDDL